MFCKNCGKEIDDKAAICVYCGVPTKAECEKKGKSKRVRHSGVRGFAGFFVVGVLLLHRFYSRARVEHYRNEQKQSMRKMQRSCRCGACYRYNQSCYLGNNLDNRRRRDYRYCF